MTAERLVQLHGALNFRDTGGLRARGGWTRQGKLYRSDSLHALDVDDRDELRRLGIGLVVDLRGHDERALFPDQLGGVDAELVHQPLSDHAMADFLARDADLAHLYDDLVDHGAERFAAVLRTVARSGDRAVVVHCTAGKDRTGLAVALALTVAGVSRDDVLDDYAATEDLLPVELLDEIVLRLRAQYLTATRNLDELVRRSPRRALARTLDRIDARHGSAAGYLRSGGLRDAELTELRRVLLEPSVQ